MIGKAIPRFHAICLELITFLFFFFITLEPEVAWYNRLCALNTRPPRNRFTWCGYSRTIVHLEITHMYNRTTVQLHNCTSIHLCNCTTLQLWACNCTTIQLYNYTTTTIQLNELQLYNNNNNYTTARTATIQQQLYNYTNYNYTTTTMQLCVRLYNCANYTTARTVQLHKLYNCSFRVKGAWCMV